MLSKTIAAIVHWRSISLHRDISGRIPFLFRPLSVRAMFVLLTASIAAEAELVRFEIRTRDDFAQGHSFGTVGPYERIVGRAYFAIDPQLRQNRNLIDLELAPRNADGKVEFFGDVFMLTPKDRSKANGALLYDVNNRGNKLALRFFNYGSGTNDPQTIHHAGDGFLMRNGFVVLWSGWDGELLPGNHRLRLSPPAVRNQTAPITGKVRCEIVPTTNSSRTVVNWANHGSYRPTKRGWKTATLTHRVRPRDPRVTIPRDQWSIQVSEVESDSPHQLPKVELEYPKGLKRGHVYELIYEAQDPLVHGTCFAAVRDLISALKHGQGANHPLLQNGMSPIKRAHGFGVSQSGRFLRELLHGGFNEDEQGRQVFDGVIPHVSGAGLGSFNHRFAQPTRHVTQHDHHDYPADRFPFAYETQRDPLSGQIDGILKRVNQTGTTPIVFHTQSAAEYWTRSGSLAHTDPMGRQDADVPENVRIYLFGGTQHGPSSFPPSRGSGKNLANPGDYRPFLRALLLALDQWVSDGIPAPPSVYPTIRAGTLVDWHQASTGFPKIPGIDYPPVIQQPSCWDYGPRWFDQRIIDRQPPGTFGDYRVLVPACDLDGNQRDCLSPPEVSVPIATYTGWNLRHAGAGAENELVSLGGSFIPFPLTKTQRAANQDPRLSVEERYRSLKDYLDQLESVCHELRDAGYLIPEDVDRTLRIQTERLTPVFEALEIAKATHGVQQIIAHRGASLERPECTVSAIRRAIEVGATAIEMDVRTSQDGVLFLLHDETLDRTTDGTGPAKQKSIQQLQELDAGSWFDDHYHQARIPKLADALHECRGRAKALLDLKESGVVYAERVCKSIREHGLPADTIIGVRSVDQAKRFRKLLPEAEQLGLIPDPKSIEAFAQAGVETIRLWPRWLEETGDDLVARVAKSNVRLHLNGNSGSIEEIMALLKHRPHSISSDDPANLRYTLHRLKNEFGFLDAIDSSRQIQNPNELQVTRRRSGTAVMLHRGAVDLAVENSQTAIEAAFLTGGDGVEVDLRHTRDGTIVLFHDPWMDRTVDAFGPIHEMTYDELLLYPFRDAYGWTRAAERVITFDQLLQLCRLHSGLLHLDIKVPGIDRQILNQIKSQKMFDHVVTINPFHSSVIRAEMSIRTLPSQGSIIHGRNDYDQKAVRSLLKQKPGTLLVDDARTVATMLSRPQRPSESLATIFQVARCTETAGELLQIARSANDSNAISRRQVLARLVLHYPDEAQTAFATMERSWSEKADSDWLWAASRLFASGIDCSTWFEEFILTSLRTSNDVEVLMAAAEAAGEAKLDVAISVLISILDRNKSSNRFHRSAALQQQAANNIRIRASAAKALGKIGVKSDQVVSALRAVAENRSLHNDGAYQGLDGAEAIKALVDLDPKRHTKLYETIALKIDERLKPVESRLEVPWWLRQQKSWWDFRIKTEAIRALGKQGTPEARSVLESFLLLAAKDAELIWRELHWDAARALCSGPRNLEERYLEKLRQHPTPAVQRTIAAYGWNSSTKH